MAGVPRGQMSTHRYHTLVHINVYIRAAYNSAIVFTDRIVVVRIVNRKKKMKILKTVHALYYNVYIT